MMIGKIGVVVIGLVPFNVYGECTPTPDCASIGYTETNCEGDYLACPFDSTKLKCMPCDSSFRYDCSGDNITGGTGSACGGKYVSCECATNYIFANGSCVCDTSCKVGAIYYSDGSCSSCVDTTKTAIGVVVKDNELVMSQIRNVGIHWGLWYVDVMDLTNIEIADEAINDYNGKENTLKIVTTYKSAGLSSDNCAAINCYEYSTEGTNVTEWYLPAEGELYTYVYSNYAKVNNTMNRLGWILGSRDFWSSSKSSIYLVWYVNLANGAIGSMDKNVALAASCFLKI